MLISTENIPSYKIDKTKWDHCIAHAANGLIYSTSSYLDSMSENWNGIVINDYEAVMPLPWRKKYGIRYAYHVPFIQQLGWSGKIETKLINEFVKELFSFYKYGDYALNYANPVPPETRHCKASSNYTLTLHIGYNNIQEKYDRDLHYNLRKAHLENFYYKPEKIETAIELYASLYGSRIKHVTKKDFLNFSMLCKLLASNKSVIVRSLCNNKDEPVSIALLLRDEKRYYNMLNCVTKEGRDSKANYVLYDKILQEFEGKEMIFDFEGSDIPGVKRFYKKFGCTIEPYTRIHFNELSWPYRLFK